jgi:hypothetical protein
MTGSGARRGRIVGGVFLAMVAVAGGVGIVLAGRGGGDEGAIEVVDTTVPRPAQQGTDAADPVVAAPAGPRDGLDSKGHPVTVEPAIDLTEGQTVAVSGSGFPANTDLGIVMCAGDGSGVGGGVSNCDIGRFSSATTDAAGAFSATFEVRRFIAPTALGFVDCFETACVVAAGALSDYDESGVVPVTFSGVEVLPPPPVLAASRTEDLLDGDEVTATLDGQPAVGVPVVQCIAARGVNACPQFGDVGPSEPNAARVALRRFLLDADLRTWVDCAEAPGRCELRLMPSDDRLAMRAAPVPLTFDASVPAPPPAAVSVEPSTGLRHGDVVAIELESVSERGYAGPLTICLRDVAGACLDAVPADDPSGRTVVLSRLVLSPTDQQWVDCGADRCVVRASPWSGIRSEEVAISFDTSVPAPPPPALRLELEPSGTSLRLTGEGLLPGVQVFAYAECEAAWSSPRLVPGADGTIDAILSVPGDECPVGVSSALASAYWSPN